MCEQVLDTKYLKYTTIQINPNTPNTNCIWWLSKLLMKLNHNTNSYYYIMIIEDQLSMKLQEHK